VHERPHRAAAELTRILPREQDLERTQEQTLELPLGPCRAPARQTHVRALEQPVTPVRETLLARTPAPEREERDTSPLPHKQERASWSTRVKEHLMSLEDLGARLVQRAFARALRPLGALARPVMALLDHARASPGIERIERPGPDPPTLPVERTPARAPTWEAQQERIAWQRERLSRAGVDLTHDRGQDLAPRWAREREHGRDRDGWER